MKIIKISFILVLVLLISCNDKNSNNSEFKELQNDTPEVLDNSSGYSLGSLSKRYSNDIIARLYEEALDKNNELKELNDKIKSIKKTKNDSLQIFQKYSQTNQNYWSTVNQYINRIDDDNLKESSLEIFKILETEYNTEISVYEEKLEEINRKTISLNDQLIIMKLVVTKSMIENYQKNEKPDIKTFERMIVEYNQLIDNIKEFIKDDK